MQAHPTPSSYRTDELRWQAVRERDSAADGSFYFAVKTTGIFCRPGCASRLPRRRNVEYFDDATEAARSGYRPCKRCRPTSTSANEDQAALVASSCRRLQDDTALPSLAELAAEAGLSPAHFHRLFKKALGVTPKQYAASFRMQRFRERLQNSPTVTDAIYDAGFGSSSRAYENITERLGMRPSTYRQGGAGLRIHYATARCSLGHVVVGATEFGICAIELADRSHEAESLLNERFPQATLEVAGEDFERLLQVVAELVDAPDRPFDLPLDVQGTAFQHRVWDALRQIPPGSTTTYSELAVRLGQPTATRAVASACAANPIAVLVPCHRVQRADGGLGGYRWGLERKRAIQERERRPAEAADESSDLQGKGPAA